MDMQLGREAETCSMETEHGNAAWAGSMDMKHRIQKGHAARTCSMNKQHGKAAGTCTVKMHTPFSRPLLF
jgi:hypothetical protein